MTLSFLPGFATTNLVWEEQQRLLGSDLEIVDKKADCIIAWSMGCFDAVHLYFQDPKKVKKLVLVSGTPKFINDDAFPQGQSLALFRNLERKIKADSDSGLKYFYSLIGNFPVFDKMPKQNKHEIFESLERLKTEDIRALLPKIDIPVLLIHGERDPICKVEASKYMAELIPKSRLVVFEGVGHAPFLERPERFASITREFLS
ncbi:MAG: alpha/beta fold hydrolase [Candidatus Saganbacteria bacterium]|nr:alpha/beta fold hydrolase [Candidatus Saganbacteria bacterium]